MELTREQQEIVELNHSLIYWYINFKQLDLSEWYDLLAIELCLTVMMYDETKGTLSTYYKRRCDNKLNKEYAKRKLKKNTNNGIYPLEEFKHHSSDAKDYDMIELQELFEGEEGEIIRLKSLGYTQTEIAEHMGVNQSYISRIIRKKYNEMYGDRL